MRLTRFVVILLGILLLPAVTFAGGMTPISQNRQVWASVSPPPISQTFSSPGFESFHAQARADGDNCSAVGMQHSTIGPREVAVSVLVNADGYGGIASGRSVAEYTFAVDSPETYSLRGEFGGHPAPYATERVKLTREGVTIFQFDCVSALYRDFSAEGSLLPGIYTLSWLADTSARGPGLMGAGIDGMFSVTPEPGTAALAVVSVALVTLRRRRPWQRRRLPSLS